MTKTLGFLSAFVAIACGAPSVAAPQFDDQAALGYVRTQVDFGPRVPNTAGHRQAGDWMLERLRATADTVEVQAFQHVTVDGDTLELRNLIGRFRPDAAERILLLAHWDTRPTAENSFNLAQRSLPIDGAVDGASGVAVLLGVADQLALEPPSFGVDILLVDGEDYGDFSVDKDVLIGSRYFAANLPEGYMPLFAILVDMVGAVDGRFPKEYHSASRAPEVVDRVWRRAAELGYGRIFENRVGQAVTDDHLPLLDVGIRAIDLIPYPFPEYHHTTDDTVDKVSADRLGVFGRLLLSLVR